MTGQAAAENEDVSHTGAATCVLSATHKVEKLVREVIAIAVQDRHVAQVRARQQSRGTGTKGMEFAPIVLPDDETEVEFPGELTRHLSAALCAINAQTDVGGILDLVEATLNQIAQQSRSQIPTLSCREVDGNDEAGLFLQQRRRLSDRFEVAHLCRQRLTRLPIPSFLGG